MLIRKIRKGQSSLEFITLLMFILICFFVFQKYITRAFTGRWKGTGDSLGQERIFDGVTSHQCAYDGVYTFAWYDTDCFDTTCGQTDCLRVTATAAACSACITSCFSPECSL